SRDWSSDVCSSDLTAQRHHVRTEDRALGDLVLAHVVEYFRRVVVGGVGAFRSCVDVGENLSSSHESILPHLGGWSTAPRAGTAVAGPRGGGAVHRRSGRAGCPGLPAWVVPGGRTRSPRSGGTAALSRGGP